MTQNGTGLIVYNLMQGRKLYPASYSLACMWTNCNYFVSLIGKLSKRGSVCVCVCVCVRERENHSNYFFLPLLTLRPLQSSHQLWRWYCNQKICCCNNFAILQILSARVREEMCVWKRVEVDRHDLPWHQNWECKTFFISLFVTFAVFLFYCFW